MKTNILGIKLENIDNINVRFHELTCYPCYIRKILQEDIPYLLLKYSELIVKDKRSFLHGFVYDY